MFERRRRQQNLVAALELGLVGEGAAVAVVLLVEGLGVAEHGCGLLLTLVTLI